MSLLRRIVDLGTRNSSDDRDFIEARHIRFTNSVSLIVCAYITQCASLALYHHQRPLLLVYLLHFVGIALVPVFNHRGHRILASAWFGGTAIVFVSLYSIVFGIESLNFAFLPMIVLLQFFVFSFAEKRWIATLSSAASLSFLAVLAADRLPIALIGGIPDGLIAAQRSNSLVGLLVLSAALGTFASVTIARADRDLLAEKEKTERLLHNILPREVALELTSKGYADPRHFDDVTILFTDFKGFTSVAEQLSPSELVDELNACFKAFDGIIAARGIEKIKTIGDAYMCASGLPDPASSTPADVVHAALEMQAFMLERARERAASGRLFFEMRVGIHTGPAVAGVVGVKKFAYDIWGDTVNIASRMESSGEVGRVNISASTYAVVKDARDGTGAHAFTFVPRGMVQAKSKGEMDMYFVARA